MNSLSLRFILLLPLTLIAYSGSYFIPAFENRTRYYFPTIAKQNAVYLFIVTYICLLVGYPTINIAAVVTGFLNLISGIIGFSLFTNNTIQ